MAIQRRALPQGHPDLLTTLVRFGQIRLDKGRPAEAEPLPRECVAFNRSGRPPEAPAGSVEECLLGRCLTALGRFDEAEPLIRESYERSRATPGDDYRGTRDAFQAVIELYQSWNRPDKLAEYSDRR